MKTQNDILLSFVIPVYNVEDYIKKCVNSILNQGCSQIEIILIDDGSTDSSGAICDEFAESSCLVKVVHQKNMGHSFARNNGLNLASGKYISFIDSDDFINENCLSEMLLWAEESREDICFLNAYKFFLNSKSELLDVLPKRSQIKSKTAEEVLNVLSLCEKFPGSACGKLFNREFLIKNNILFPTDLLYGEDLSFMVYCFLNAQSFDRLDIDYYYYRQGRSGSVTSCKNKEVKFKDLSKFVENTIRLVDNFGEKRDAISSFAAYEYSILLWTYCLLEKTFKKEAFCFLKNYKYILKFGKSKKLVFVRKFVSIFGIKITSYLMNLWMNVR